MKRAAMSDFNLYFLQANYGMALVKHVLQLTDTFFKREVIIVPQLLEDPLLEIHCEATDDQRHRQG